MGLPQVALPNWLITSADNSWSGNQTFNDNVKVLFGTLGADGEIYSDGTDLFFNQLSGGGIMVGLASSFPSPDGVAVHIWKGSAGSVTADSNAAFVIEDNDTVYLNILTPNDRTGAIFFGDPEQALDGGIQYLQGSQDMIFRVGNTNRLSLTGALMAFQQAQSISTISGSLTLDPTTVVILAKALSGTPTAVAATSEGVAIPVTATVVHITTNGDSDEDALTLADGVDGQLMFFAVVAVGNASDSVKITPASMIGGTKITFAADPLGLGCIMQYDLGADGWTVVGNNGGTVA